MVDGLRISAVVVAGGSGLRMGGGMPKQFIKLCGKPLLAYAVEIFEACALVDEIILVVPEAFRESCEVEIVEEYGFKKTAAVVSGGNDRQESVYNGIVKTQNDSDIILVHDGVRLFVSENEIARLIQAAKEFGSACLGVKVKETIKRCGDDNSIISTVDRSELWAAQTPQCFKRSLIAEVHEKARAAGVKATDDAFLVECFSDTPSVGKVKMIEGSYNNIKITTPEDLLYAEFLLSRKQEREE